MITQRIKIKTMADVGHYMFTKSVFYTPALYWKNTSEFPVSIVLILMLTCLLWRKRNSNLTDSVVYQNAGPTMNFLSNYTLAFDRCIVTSEYIAMHTANMHTILLESLLSDV